MRTNEKLCHVVKLATGACCLIVVYGAYAQTTNTAVAVSQGDSDSLMEIVVTAQRRSESLQSVPISVTVVTANQLAQTGITGIDDLSMLVPTLNVQNGAGYLLSHLRGIGATTVGAGLENPVALYIDGVYYANQSVGFFSFNNLSQVEVLKGPQGTLFGRNSTAGLIQLTTAEPTQEFQMKADIGASNYSGTDGNLYVAGGVASNLAADVAVHGSRSNGYGTNLFNGQDVYAQPWDVAIRSKWVYTPDNWKATLIGDYSNTDNSYNALAVIPGTFVSRPFFPAPELGSDPWNVNTNIQPLVKHTDMGTSLKIEHDFGSVLLSNLAAGRRSTLLSQFDDDGTPVQIESLGLAQRDWQASDELQLTSNSTGPLKWVSGLYYFYDESKNDPSTVSLGTSPEFNPKFPLGTLLISGQQDTASIAGYAQATYDITDQLDMTAGARYSHEHRSLVGVSENGVLLVPDNPVIPLGPPIPDKSKSFNDPTYRLALDYKITPDAMIYGSFNTGFKSGGYNVSDPTDPVFAAEKLYAYEIGEKVEIFDHKLRIDSGVFYYNYLDIQVQKPEATGVGIINGAKANVYGFDGEINARPFKPVEITLGLSLLHTKFNDFPDAPISTPGGGIPTTFGDVSGNQLPYAPKAVVNLGVTYFIVPSLALNAAYYHSSSYFFAPDDVTTQGSYDKVNASVQWTAESKHYWVRAYGDNLTNAAVIGSLLTTPAGIALQTLQPPRMYGVKVGFNY